MKLSRKQKATKKTGLPEPDYKALYEYGEGTIRARDLQIQTMFEQGLKVMERYEKQVEDFRIVTALQNADDRRRIEGVQACRDHEVAQCRSLITFPIETVDFLLRYARRGILETRKSQPTTQGIASCQKESESEAEENIGGGGKDAN